MATEKITETSERPKKKKTIKRKSKYTDYQRDKLHKLGNKILKSRQIQPTKGGRCSKPLLLNLCKELELNFNNKSTIEELIVGIAQSGDSGVRTKLTSILDLSRTSTNTSTSLPVASTVCL